MNEHLARLFFSLVAVVSLHVFAADTPPVGVTLVDLTTAESGSVVSAGTPYSNDRNADKAFDGSVSGDTTRWLVPQGENSWFVYQFNTPTVLTSYTIVNGGSGGANQDTRAPKAWTLSGSNDEGDEKTWTTLDSRTGETQWSIGETRYYACQQATYVPYTYYKFICTENNGQANLQIHEIYFYDVRNYDVDAPALTPVGDGNYLLTGQLNAVEEGAVKAVFSAPGTHPVEVTLGEFSANASISYVVNPTTLGLSMTAFTTVKLVVPDGADGKATEIPGSFFFGGYATALSEFDYKFEVTPSADALSLIGSGSYTDFPVLVRLSANITGFDYSRFRYAGRDMLIVDETGAALAFEIENWNPAGESFVWVKVPSLSASTVLTCYYGARKPSAKSQESAQVWSKYVGVWHFAADEVGGTTVKDSTGHALDATTANALTSVEGPFGGAALTSGAVTRAPDPEPNYQLGSSFTASGWCLAPTLVSGDYVTVVKKKGSTWNADNGWYIEYSGDTTTMKLILTDATSVSVSDVRTNWHHFTVVSDGSTVKLYLDGNSTAKLSKSYQVKANSEPYTLLSTKLQGDEYRLRKGAATGAEVALEYGTMKNDAFFSYGAVEATDVSAPTIGDPTVVRNVDGSFTISVKVTENAPKSDTVKCVVDGTAYAMTGSGIGTYTVTLDALTAGTKTAMIALESVGGSEVTRNVPQSFYVGDLTLALGQNAQEDGLVTGYLTVTRGDTLGDLVVNFEVDAASTAVAGQTYETLVSPVVIPDGENSVRIEVKPLMDAAVNADATVIVNLTSGPYGIDATQGSVQLTVVNLAPASEWNTWVATEPGRASDAANWSAGHAPLATEKVQFDGRFSTAKCTWDAEATHTVAAWKQGTGYAETIEFDTEFPSYEGATFALFTVTGDCEILSGGWTCRGNYANYGAATESATVKLATKRWCLNVSVAGDLTVAEGASINVTGKGFGHPGNQNSPCYGGMNFDASLVSNPYGSITEPFDPGMGCRSQGDQNRYRSATGGGAVKLVVGGTVTLDGSILAVGTGDLNIARSAGTGGSIWIDATQIAGTGTIDASGAPTSVFTSDQGVAIGSGGRVALYTKSTLALARDRILCGGSGYAVGSALAKTKIASCGTIFIKDQSMANGVLVLKQPSAATSLSANARVPLMDETTTLDAIELSGRVLLSVDAGKTLVLPNGFASVTSSSTAVGENGLTLRGGTVDVGSGDQTISGWMLEPVVTYAFPANVSLVHAGAIGILRRNFCGTGDAQLPPRAISFSVAGNLSVDETSAVSVANAAAYSNYLTGQKAGWHGGWTTYFDKSGDKTDARELTYGSVFDPVSPGSSPTRYFPAGGAVVMTVAGELSLAGSISADGPFSDNQTDNVAPSSGGSINLTAGAISGAGSITACGGSGRYSYAGGGAGGRIAVKLTRANATLPEGLTINAQGRYGYAFNAKANKLGSAGTVYVQTAANGEKGGTISISNWPDRKIADFTSATVIPTTPIVAFVDGDAAADFKRSSLVVTNNAIAEVSVETLSLKSLAIAEDSKLDLNGRRLVVKAATLGGERLYPGSYKASDAAVSAFVMDSAGTDGTLEVTGGGFKFILR